MRTVAAWYNSLLFRQYFPVVCIILCSCRLESLCGLLSNVTSTDNCDTTTTVTSIMYVCGSLVGLYTCMLITIPYCHSNYYILLQDNFN